MTKSRSFPHCSHMAEAGEDECRDGYRFPHEQDCFIKKDVYKSKYLLNYKNGVLKMMHFMVIMQLVVFIVAVLHEQNKKRRFQTAVQPLMSRFMAS